MVNRLHNSPTMKLSASETKHELHGQVINRLSTTPKCLEGRHLRRQDGTNTLWDFVSPC